MICHRDAEGAEEDKENKEIRKEGISEMFPTFLLCS